MVEHAVSKKLRRLVLLFGFLLLAIIGLCIWQYRPPTYEFFTQTISDLGAILKYTYEGSTPIPNDPNSISRWIFTVGFVILGIISIGISTIYFKHNDLYADKTKGILTITLAIGAILTAYPWDGAYYEIHAIGTLLFVSSFGFYNFVCQRLRYVRKHEIVKENDVSFWKKLDNFFDLIVAILVFFILVWYLFSGVIGHFYTPEDYSWLIYFPTGFAQKCLLIICLFAMVLFDLDDM